MGFFETLYKGMVETEKKSIEEKYNKMPLDQLKKEWKDTFAHRDYSMREMYAEKSPVGILDRVYSERTFKKTWKEECEKYLENNGK